MSVDFRFYSGERRSRRRFYRCDRNRCRAEACGGEAMRMQRRRPGPTPVDERLPLLSKAFRNDC
jgi:hypothetical protein